ncbi:MAG: acyl carrier protein [Oscillospiraceae bacterium]
MFEQLKEVIASTLSCDINDVKLESNLAADLGADSLDAVELSMAIEDAFDITIEDDALAKLKTVADILNLIQGDK